MKQGARHIDLNADLGEGMAFDAELLEIVTSASIACGGHAGDKDSMVLALNQAKLRGVRTGAHPSFVDPVHFGRRKLDLAPDIIVDQVLNQIDVLMEIGAHVGQAISYVKLHGALYNLASNDLALSAKIFENITSRFEGLAVMVMANSAQSAAAQALGIVSIEEAFVDRAYLPNGRLMDRAEQGAVFNEAAQAVRQAISIARDGRVVSSGGKNVSVAAQSLCVHGDNEHAVELARAVKTGLNAAGVEVRAT